MARGLGAMVWKLRDWKGGDPVAQIEHAVELGLDHVSIKIVDGADKRWEREDWFPNNQNADLLIFAIETLRAGGVEVTGWGYTWGGQWINRKLGIFRKSKEIARAEGRKAGELCKWYELNEFLIDAEAEYQRDGMEEVAEAYMLGFQETGPDVRQLLCSYRFPLTYQPKFPVRAFAPYMEGWSPQVYFVGDQRKSGGAIQLETSKRQYDSIRKLSFMPVAPTYKSGSWRASGDQLKLFFEKAMELACEGVSVWDLPQASEDQLDAIRAFDWPGVGPITEDPVSRLRTIADEIESIAAQLEEQSDGR